MNYIINVRNYPEWLERAVGYFSSRWNIDQQLYLDSISNSLTTENAIPRWYLMICDDNIIGGFGLIENDFMVRTDLSPWLCALYIEPNERGNQLGSKLLAHCLQEAAVLGFDKVYLNTSHIGYYERYHWRFIGNYAHKSGDDVRIYEADTVRIETSRLILRPFTEHDAAAVAHNSKQYSVAHSMPEMVKETSEEALSWIRYVNMKLFDSTKPCVLLAIIRKTDRQCVGCIFVQWKEEWGNELEMG